MQFLNQLILTIPDRKASITESLKLMAEGWGGIFIVIAIMMLCILALNKAFSGSTKKLSKTSIALIAATLVVAAALIFVFSGAGKPSAADSAESFMEACFEGDVEKADKYSYGSIKGDIPAYCTIGTGGATMSNFKVTDTESVTDENEIKKISVRYDIDREIEKVQQVSAEMTMEFNGQKVDSPGKFIVCLIDGTWYVVGLAA